MRAQAALATGNAVEAEALLTRYLRRKPKDAEALALAGVLALQRGAAAEAQRRLRRAAKLRPEDAALLTNLGIAEEAAGEPNAAVASLTQACRLRPDFAQAAYNLGVLLRRLERPSDAAEALARACDLEPGYAKAKAALAGALLDAGRTAEALTAAESALQTAETEDTRLTAGLAAKSLDRWEQAIAHLDRAGERPEALLELAHCRQEAGELAAAQATYRAALAIDPGLYAAAVKRLVSAAKGELPLRPAALRLWLLG
ncbi:MAG: tetratricopeptide repeat protein [Kiloniellales bacterium]